MALQGIKINTNIANVKTEFFGLIKDINNAIKNPFIINFSINDVNKQLEGITKQLKDLQKNTGFNINTSEFKNTINDVANSMDKIEKKQLKIVDGEETQQIEQVRKSLIETEKIITNLKTGSKTNIITDDYAKAQNNLYQNLNKLQEQEYTIQTKMIGADETKTAELVKQLNIIEEQVLASKEMLQKNNLTSDEKELEILNKKNILQSELNIKYNDYENKQKLSTAEIQKQIELTKQQYTIALQNLNTKYGSLTSSSGISQQIKQFESELNNLDSGNFNKTQISNNFKQLESNIKSSSSALHVTNKEAESFSSILKNDIVKMGEWAISGALLFGTTRKIGEAFQFVYEQSKVFTVLQMEMTGANLVFSEITNTANEYAHAMSTTTDNVTKAIGVFATYTTTMDEVLAKSKAAIILNNITGQGIEATSNDLMGVLSQFNLQAEDSMHVADIITGTARMLQVDYPIAVQSISEGLRTVGSVAAESKVPIELLSSMLGTLSEKTRKSGSEIANSLRTIFGRILNVGEEADPESFKKIEKELNSLKISIREVGDPSSLRPVGDILADLASKWKDLDDVTKESIAFDAAGMYRKNTFITLMENYSTVLDNNESALHSNGVAMQKQEIYENSLQASTQRLKSSWEELYLTIANADTMKNVVNDFTGLVTGIDSIVGKFGLLNTVGLLVADTIGIKLVLATRQATIAMVQEKIVAGENVSAFGMLGQGLSKAISSMLGLESAATVATGSIVALNIATAGIAAGLVLIPILITTIIGKTEEARRKSEQAAQERQAQLKTIQEDYKNEVQNLEQLNTLIEEQQRIQSKGDDKQTADEKQRLHDIELQLAKAIPEATTSYDQQNQALAENYSLTEKLVKMKKELADSKALEVVSSVNATEILNKIKQAKDMMNQLDGLLNETDENKFNESWVNFYNNNIKNIDKDTANDLSKSASKGMEEQLKVLASYHSKLSKEVLDGTNTLNQYNGAAEWYNQIGKKQFEIVEDNSLGIGKNTKETKENTNAKKENNNEINRNVKTILSNADSQKEFANQLKESKSVIGDVNDLLEAHSKSNEWNTEKIIELAQTYPELLAAMGSDKELTQALIDIKNKQSNSVVQSLQTQIDAENSFINNLASSYGVDIANFTSKETNKSAILKKAISDRIKLLEVESRAYMSSNDYASDAGFTNKVTSSFANSGALTQAYADLANVDTYLSNYAKLQTISANIGKYLGTSGSNSYDGKGDAAKTAEQIQQEAMQNVLDLQQKLVSAKKALYEADKDNAIKALKEKEDAEVSYYQGKIKQLQDEISALQDTKDDDKKKLDALKKELAAWQKENINGDGTQYGKNMVNTIQKQIDDLTKQMTIKDKQDQISQLEADQKAREDYYTQQQNTVTTRYDNLLQDTNLYAEANNLILTRATSSIVDLLTKYEPEFNNIGQLLGKTMSQTFLEEVGKSLGSANTLNIPHYANGTYSALPGVKYINENGDELLISGGGESIIPADITKNLIPFGKDPFAYLSKLIPRLNMPKLDVIKSQPVVNNNYNTPIVEVHQENQNLGEYTNSWHDIETVFKNISMKSGSGIPIMGTR